jgi:hypothetical protein
MLFEPRDIPSIVPYTWRWNGSGISLFFLLLGRISSPWHQHVCHWPTLPTWC